MGVFYIDGEFVPAEKAVLPVNDLAVVRGLGVFDLMRTYNGKPFFLMEHLERLQRSADRIDLTLRWSLDELADVVMQTLSRNSYAESNIRVVVTGGSSSDFITPDGRPRLLVLVTPLPQLPGWWYTDGAKVITFCTRRSLTGTKSINYIQATMALRQARQADAVEAVYKDSDGYIQEGTTTNVFAFIDEKLVTPGGRILCGITRQVVLDLAKDHYPIEFRDISVDEFLKAHEIFITGTSKGLLPIVQVNETIIGDGKPGKHTRKLMQLLEELVQLQFGCSAV